MLEPRQNRSSGCWKRKTRLERILIPSCLILCVVSVVLLVSHILNSPEADDICTSKYCVKSSAELLDYADFKENPCEDFYKYTCGSFIKKAVKKQATTPLVSLTEELENELKAIVVDPVGKKNPPALVLMKQFYQHCMDENKIDEDNSMGFLKAIDELGGWPLMKGEDWNETDFHWVDWHVRASRLGLPIFGFFTFQRVTTGSDKTILQISGRSSETNFFVSKSKFNRIITEVLESMMDLSDENGTYVYAEENRKVQEFKEKIALLNLPKFGRLEVKTLKNVQEDCPFVPWLKLLNSLANGNEVFKNSSKVVYGQIKQYCVKLNDLLNNSTPRTVANYFVWSILHQTSKYLSVRKIYGEMQYGSSSRFDTCFTDVDERFKYVKETVYVIKKTPKKVRKDLSEMIDLMKEVFIEHIKASDWMDSKTKNIALEKTAQIESMIGGADELYEPEFFETVLGIGKLDFSSGNLFEMSRQKGISENEHFFKTLYLDEDPDWPGFFKNMLKVNAFFAPPLNVMILPAPILNSIFYDHRKPAFMNYGSIGRIIGHEIMHGFEKSARYVAFGNGMIDWWTNKTAEAYDRKVKCVIDNYEKIPFRYRLNGTLTLDENVSDFVGIDVAYEAYLKYIEKHGPEKGIPGIHLRPEQIFWIQTGTWLCFRKLDDSDIDYEEEDEHAIPGFRVQAGARNSLYFAKNFNCPEGSFMNPKNKCRVL